MISMIDFDLTGCNFASADLAHHFVYGKSKPSS